MTQMKNTVILLGRTKKTLFLALAMIFALVILLSLSKPDKSETQAQGPGAGAMEAPPMMVRVETVGTINGTQPIEKVAPVLAKETVELVPRVSGYLESIKFKEGDYVNKGDLLFEIEDTIYEINVRMAEAVVKQTEAEVALAEQNRDRVTSLTPNRVATKQEVDEAARGVLYQEGRLEEAKAKLDQAKTDLSYTKIYAPLSGRIGAKQFSVGNYLTPQSGVLATIRQFDPITLAFPVTEREFMTYFLHNGGNKKINIEVLMANYLPYQGEYEIDFLDNQVDSSTGQIMIFLICKNADTKLLPGGWTKVNLSEQFEQPRPAASIMALMKDSDHHYVYVVTNDNKVERRDVVIGDQVFDKLIITSGLTPGEKIVVGGLNRIKPNDVITPVEINKTAVPVEQKVANQSSDTINPTGS